MSGVADTEGSLVQLWVPWCMHCDAPMQTMAEPGFAGKPPRAVSYPIRVCRACGQQGRVMHVPWVAVS